jgi:hypothetical protein
VTAFGLDLEAMRAEIASRGAYTLDGLLPAGRVDELADEGESCLGSAEPLKLEEFQLGVEGQLMRSPMRLAVAPGALLNEVHRDGELVELVSSLAGRAMEPSKTVYLYFRGGDFIGLHLDQPACELVLLAALDEDAPPLVVYPELRDSSPEELLELAKASAGAPPGGAALPIRRGSMIALDGGVAPHQTPPRAGDADVSTLVTLCYVARRPS